MATFAGPVYGLLKTKTAAATLPAPSTSSDGVQVSGAGVSGSWAPRQGGGGPVGYTAAAIALFADGAATVTLPALYAYGPYGASGASMWMFVAYLNNGLPIALTSAIGFVQQIQLPSVFERLSVGGTVSANNVGYTATPIAIIGGG